MQGERPVGASGRVEAKRRDPTVGAYQESSKSLINQEMKDAVNSSTRKVTVSYEFDMVQLFSAALHLSTTRYVLALDTKRFYLSVCSGAD